MILLRLLPTAARRRKRPAHGRHDEDLRRDPLAGKHDAAAVAPGGRKESHREQKPDLSAQWGHTRPGGRFHALDVSV